MRYDPIWRRIKGDEFTSKLEGRFSERRHRLDDLNNWGVLSWLYPHASASKLAHHYGLEMNACSYLAGGHGERDKYRDSFRVAAHVLHWGHLPLSYAAEEGILRAAHADPDVQRVVERVVKEVADAGQLVCTDRGHDCLTGVSEGERYYDLYRWLSAWLVVADWKKIWKVIQDASDGSPDEKTTKQQIIATLVCRQDRGYRILSMCNRADFVPRDLLQAGTAWLSFDLETLWETNPLGSDAAKEWTLVSAAETYLDNRFFRVPESLLVHSLASRAIAGGLLAGGVSRDLLKALLKEGDDYYEKKLTQYHRKRLAEVRASAITPRLSDRWQHVGSWENVSLPAGSRFAMEDHLTGHTGKARSSYPFSDGISVFVEVGRSRLPVLWAGSRRRHATVHLHHGASEQKGGAAAFPALEVVSKISAGLEPGHEPGDSLMSWLLRQPTAQGDDAVGRVAAEILASQQATARASVEKLVALKTVESLIAEGPVWLTLLRGFAEEASSAWYMERLGSLFFLRLPWPILKLSPGKALMRLVRDEAVKRAAGRSAARGYALEAATVADQWLAGGDPVRRFVFFNCYMLGKDQQAEKEFDVIRIDVLANRTWRLTAVECAAARSEAKDAEGREKLELLRTRLQGRFSDLTTYRALLAERGPDGSLSYEDAGRGFSVDD